jgi:hypothetical protein
VLETIHVGPVDTERVRCFVPALNEAGQHELSHRECPRRRPSERNAMRRKRTLIGVVAAIAAAAGLVVVNGQGADAGPIVTASGGLAVCPTAGQPFITAPDGTICANTAGVYEVLNISTDNATTVQIVLRTPYKGFVSAGIEQPVGLALTVGLPTNSKTLYKGPLQFYWYIAR